MTPDKRTRREVLGAVSGSVVASSLIIGTVGGETPETASITFEDQPVRSRGQEQTVVIAEVRLPDPGGFIDIHDPNDTKEMPLGQIQGANDDYLEPGVHHDMEVELFEDFNCHEFDPAARLEESKELMAMPHRDEPTDHVFTHFCEHGEGGVEDGGFGDFPNVVQDTAYVEVPPDGRGNPSPEGEENRSRDR